MTFNRITAIVQDESGATAIEYGLIAALIAVVLMGALQVLGTDLATFFQDIAAALPEVPAP
ncbi:MAG: Flp family type IVb pilin [Rhodospirillales bacterium]|nr:MAG: Flp family type IVb pilin [Rhodospirillales bacterium]